MQTLKSRLPMYHYGLIFIFARNDGTLRKHAYTLGYIHTECIGSSPATDAKGGGWLVGWCLVVVYSSNSA